MAFDTAIHFLDELKDKYMHEVEKAIDDWDYQDFSPDKRTPLLENEIIGDAADDLAPEPNALQQIKEASKLDWSGISRDQMLANQGFGRMSISSNSSACYETQVVVMATPAGGVQGLPDAAALQRFVQHATVVNPQALADAFCARLQHSTWQIRAKTLVLIEVLLESPDLVGMHLPLLRAHASLLKVVDNIRTQDHSPIARENARKVVSLIRSNGTNAMLVPREHIPPKPHVRHTPTEKKKKVDVVPKPNLTVRTVPNKTTILASSQQPRVISPKIAAAAFASAQRRSQKELLANSTRVASPTNAKTMTVVAPPAAPGAITRGASLSRTQSATLQKMGSSRSGFAFVEQPAPRVSVPASRTQSFR